MPFMTKVAYSKSTTTVKNERHTQLYYNNQIQTPFSNLKNMLNYDINYSPFLYYKGRRGIDYIRSSANFIVLDIDEGLTTIYEEHENLLNEDVNHIISTTSDNSVLYKYRILLPLSREVTKHEYTRVVKGLKEYGLIKNIDPASAKPSQTFYAYKNSLVLAYPEGVELNVESYILPERKPLQHSSFQDCSEIMQSYRAPKQYKGNDALVSASFALLLLGTNAQEYEQCIKQLNMSWLFPMNETLLYNTIIHPMIQKHF